MNLKYLLTFLLPIATVSCLLAQEFVLDSAYYDMGVVSTEDFANAERNYYRAYDEDNRPLVIETQRYLEGDSWENWRRRDYTYTDEGYLTQLITSAWQASSESWVPLKGRNYFYDNDGNIVGRQEAVAAQVGEPLVDNRRWQYTYEGPGLQTEALLQGWQDGAWVNESRQLWNYNANELPISQLSQHWGGLAWKDARRRMWDYTDGIVSQVTEQRFDELSGEWVNVRRNGYQNSGSLLWDQSVKQEWNGEAGAWQNVSRELISYNPGGTVNRRTFQFWEGEDWLNRREARIEWMDGAINIINDQWDVGNNDWEMDARYQLRFNDTGLKIVEQGWQYWSTQMNAWLNAMDTERWRYFWSEVIVSTQEVRPSADCLIPNPYHSGESIRCTSLPQSGSFTLELVNEIGQLVHTQIVAEGSDFTISTSLPQGWYVCRLRQGKQLLHLQAIVLIP